MPRGKRSPRARIAITEFPARLATKINADQRRKNLSINDLISSILSPRYGLKHERSGRPPRAEVVDRIIYKPEIPLYEKIRKHAFDTRNSMAGLIVYSLCEHYGIDNGAPTKSGVLQQRGPK